MLPILLEQRELLLNSEMYPGLPPTSKMEHFPTMVEAVHLRNLQKPCRLLLGLQLSFSCNTSQNIFKNLRVQANKYRT